MEFDFDLHESLAKLKANALYELAAFFLGMVLTVLLLSSTGAILIMLNTATLLLVVVGLFHEQKFTPPFLQKHKEPESNPGACPECGSTRRHRLTCSHSKRNLS